MKYLNQIAILTFFCTFLSCKPNSPNEEKPGKPINVNVSIDSLSSYQDFNKQVCAQSATILFFDKSICAKLLNPPFPMERGPIDQIETRQIAMPISGVMHKDTFSNVCGQPLNGRSQLVGYYLSPSDDINSGQPLKLNFNPVWSTPSNNRMIETIGEAISLTPSGLCETSNIEAIQGENDLIIPVLPYSPANTNGFNHNILQFHHVAVQDTFMKAYVSWYELKLIFEHCTYLGISGALVNTGNFKVVEHGNRKEGAMFQSCPKSYFTYRFIGFNEFWGSRELKKLVPSNAVKSATASYDAAIPTETWAVPCPPRWKPM